MQSKPSKEHWIDLAVLGGEMGREDCQKGWHELAATLELGIVLDVGAGLGLSKERIPHCTTQDPAYGLPVDVITPVTVFGSRTFDTVTAFDVIEHVKDDVDFLRELCRIASRYVFVTTPNLYVSRAENGCHCREYTPYEFVRLSDNCLPDWRIKVLYAGDGDGKPESLIKFVPRTDGIIHFTRHDQPHHAFLLERIES